MAKIEKIDAELASVGTESKACMERVRKYVWELKAALGLKFSQQRGAQPQAEAARLPRAGLFYSMMRNSGHIPSLLTSRANDRHS